MFPIARSMTAVLDLLLPPACLLCSEVLHPAQEQRFFCQRCMEGAEALGSGCCRRCAQPYHASETDHLCGNCLKSPPAFTAVYTVGKYAGSIRSAIQQLKYRNQLALAKALGELLAASVRKQAASFSPDCVIPVPLHVKRLRGRGFNQALEIARPLARALSVPLHANLLQRARHTPQQQGLSATERHKNLRNAFSLASSPKARSVLLVDDVMTTGETVRECSRILLAGGMKEVRIAVVGRA